MAKISATVCVPNTVAHLFPNHNIHILIRINIACNCTPPPSTPARLRNESRTHIMPRHTHLNRAYIVSNGLSNSGPLVATAGPAGPARSRQHYIGRLQIPIPHQRLTSKSSTSTSSCAYCVLECVFVRAFALSTLFDLSVNTFNYEVSNTVGPAHIHTKCPFRAPCELLAR